MIFSYEKLRLRAFERASVALYSLWEEQQHTQPRSAAVHSRIFDTLIYNEYIKLNEKAPGRMYPEHVVPCAYIRNHAFNMFWDDKSKDDVAEMIGRLLRIAYITTEQAKVLNAVHKYTMPVDWEPNSGSVLRRLEDKGIEIISERKIFRS